MSATPALFSAVLVITIKNFQTCTFQGINIGGLPFLFIGVIAYPACKVFYPCQFLVGLQKTSYQLLYIESPAIVKAGFSHPEIQVESINIGDYPFFFNAHYLEIRVLFHYICLHEQHQG